MHYKAFLFPTSLESNDKGNGMQNEAAYIKFVVFQFFLPLKDDKSKSALNKITFAEIGTALLVHIR
jgi:hypothetical protein